MKKIPHEVIIECLALREQRSNIDLVADVTESQLNKVYVHIAYICTCACRIFEESFRWVITSVDLA